jgi:hypothetical protein
VLYRKSVDAAGDTQKSEVLPCEEIFTICSKKSRYKCSIRAQFKKVSEHLPRFGRGGADLRQFVNQTAGQLTDTRKEFLSWWNEVKSYPGVIARTQSLLIDTIFQVDWVDPMLLSYIAIHRRGFAVICKKLPFYLIKRVLDIVLHRHSTLLTPNGLVRFYKKISELFGESA